jgi:hypothetical protein
VDAFEIGVLFVVGAAVLACCLAARASAGKRLGEFGARRGASGAAASEDAYRDAQDLQEMLEATNARRRARGLQERSVADAMREFGGD